MRYRAGWGATVMSLKSVAYCGRALDYLRAQASAVANGMVALPTIVSEAKALPPRFGRPPVGGFISRSGVVAAPLARAGFVARPGTWKRLARRDPV
jgi:hypothetical protein